MDSADIACSTGSLENSNFAQDQARLEISYAVKSRILGMALADIASIKGTWQTDKVAKAHKVFVQPYAPNLHMHCKGTSIIAPTSCCHNACNVASSWTVLAEPCVSNS
eukprot:gnl/MRDRNA2_/MRDRNA2_83162_c0_seq1.p1 gnl/MRDRNA2_/MRDRNA2_83162_c0~~gnl/MRDRNA2_/MRDRNA2_83162_c0_seq1.p1  ORF type:complete len:108 (+),score=10.20 gnl/MRDRNA2_/MRDRNA2_83162_c0_seq1:193-516(+)